MDMLKRYLLLATAILSLLPATAAGADKSALPAAEFLETARSNRANADQQVFAILRGRLRHRRRGQEEIGSWPVTFRILIAREHSLGQLVIGTDESYLLRHRAGESYSNFATSTGKTTEKLSRAGVKASDLVLGFIAYDLEKELPRQSLSAGLIPCRVLQLKGSDETAKVWFMASNAIPLRAEFFRPGENTPYRSIEITRGDKFDGVYCATQIKIDGPGWRTMVDFEKGNSVSGIYRAGSAPVIVDQKEIFEEHRKRISE